MRNLFSVLLVIFFITNRISAQIFTGFSTSNYAGISSIYQNPAAIADGRYAFDMNLVGLDLSLFNNYISFDTELLKLEDNPMFDSKYQGAFQQFRNDFFNEVDFLTIDQSRVHQNLSVVGPSFGLTIGKHTFAFTSAARQYMSIDNLDPTTTDFVLDELLNQNLWNVDLDNDKLNIQTAAWMEYGLAYGREIYSDKQHFLKGAIHVKALVAMFGAYLYADRLQVNFRNEDTVKVNISDVRFGYSNNLKDDILGETFSSADNFFNRASFSLDIGFEYEWRPKYADYELADKPGEYSRTKNKYKLKAGLCFRDMGAITFDRGVYAGAFEGFSFDWDLDTFASATDGIETFGELMNDTFNMTSNRDPFTVRLPVSMGIQVDYNIWRGFYINLAANLAFDQNDAPLMIHELNRLTLTPRYEHTWFDIGVPVTFDGLNNIHAGLYARLGPLFVGSSNCWNMLIKIHCFSNILG